MNYIKLMYITNSPEIALIVEQNGVERIFVDMEVIGKEERQGGMDTVQSHHTFDDIKAIKSVITKSELMVRCNPIHPEMDGYCSSQNEIDKIIECGADIVMLPYFKTAKEVRDFVQMVAGRAKTIALLETKGAVEHVDEILKTDGLDEIYIGLNDLSLSYGKKFMFELLADGTVEKLCEKFRASGIPYGFGGMASVDKGLLLGENVIKEHYRLNSSMVILSRSFCDANKENSLEAIKEKFKSGIKAIRNVELKCHRNIHDSDYFAKNKEEIKEKVNEIVSYIR